MEYLSALLFFAVIFAILLIAIAIIRFLIPVIGRRTELSPRSEAGDPRLVRFPQRATIGGVCAGFAYKFGVPTWMVQVIWVVLAFGMSGIPLIAYVIFWIMMPKASEFPVDYDTRTESF